MGTTKLSVVSHSDGSYGATLDREVSGDGFINGTWEDVLSLVERMAPKDEDVVSWPTQTWGACHANAANQFNAAANNQLNAQLCQQASLANMSQALQGGVTLTQAVQAGAFGGSRPPDGPRTEGDKHVQAIRATLQASLPKLTQMLESHNPTKGSSAPAPVFVQSLIPELQWLVDLLCGKPKER